MKKMFKVLPNIQPSTLSKQKKANLQKVLQHFLVVMLGKPVLNFFFVFHFCLQKLRTYRFKAGLSPSKKLSYLLQ